MNQTIDPESLRLTPDVMAKYPAPHPSTVVRKPKREIEFYKIPREVMEALVRMDYLPAWRLVAAILRAHYGDYDKRNPVRLTSARLAEFRISRGQKLKGLKRLEETGLFRVERSAGRNPQVTMMWKL